MPTPSLPGTLSGESAVFDSHQKDTKGLWRFVFSGNLTIPFTILWRHRYLRSV